MHPYFFLCVFSNKLVVFTLGNFAEVACLVKLASWQVSQRFSGVPGNFLQQKKVTTTENLTEAVFCTSCWKSRSYNTFLLQVVPNFSCTLFTAFETVCSWSETCLLTSWLPKNSKETVFSCPKSMDAYSSLQSNILQRTWWFLNDRTLRKDNDQQRFDKVSFQEKERSDQAQKPART